MAGKSSDRNRFATVHLHNSRRASLLERILPVELLPSPQAHLLRESRAASVAPAPFAAVRVRDHQPAQAFVRIRSLQPRREPEIAMRVSHQNVVHTQATRKLLPPNFARRNAAPM